MIRMTDMALQNLEFVRFFTEPLNYEITKFLLKQTEGISIKDVANELDINKSQAKYRLNQFAERYYCSVGIDIPKFEEQRRTKSYKLMYMLKPFVREKLNQFVDYIDNVVLIELECITKESGCNAL